MEWPDTVLGWSRIMAWNTCGGRGDYGQMYGVGEDTEEDVSEDMGEDVGEDMGKAMGGRVQLWDLA